MQNVKIYIEDGTVLNAKTNFANIPIIAGELVFTTSMTGYQEIITDPSFAGQIVVMTYPLIGNYGTKKEWSQSGKIYAKAMVVQSLDVAGDFGQFLNKFDVPVISSVDTRNLVHLIRRLKYPRCVLSLGDLSRDQIMSHVKSVNLDVVPQISTKAPLVVLGLAANHKTIAVFDFGVKNGIIDELKQYFSKIIVLPHNSSYQDVVETGACCVMLSNGPGNPESLCDSIVNIREMLGKIPIYGICLGHQLLGLALNCKTEAMKFGHRGANHPVINVKTGQIIITSQNHGYQIAEGTMSPEIVVTHRNIHDNSIEGIMCARHNVRSVQFHPESSPGPEDARIIFKEWFG